MATPKANVDADSLSFQDHFWLVHYQTVMEKASHYQRLIQQMMALKVTSIGGIYIITFGIMSRGPSQSLLELGLLIICIHLPLAVALLFRSRIRNQFHYLRCASRLLEELETEKGINYA